MKKQLFNSGWTVNGEAVTLPRDEMIRAGRRADAPAGDAQGFFLGGNVFIDRPRLCTVVILIRFSEFPAAFGAFPSHRFTSAKRNLR